MGPAHCPHVGFLFQKFTTQQQVSAVSLHTAARMRVAEQAIFVNLLSSYNCNVLWTLGSIRRSVPPVAERLPVSGTGVLLIHVAVKHSEQSLSFEHERKWSLQLSVLPINLRRPSLNILLCHAGFALRGGTSRISAIQFYAHNSNYGGV